MRAHVRCRSETTKRFPKGYDKSVDEQGWTHIYDCGMFELQFLVRAFSEVEIVEWGEMWRSEYKSEKASMEKIVSGKKKI